MTWIIMAHRSAASMFGEAHAPVTHKGNVVTFATEAEAREAARHWNENLKTMNVHYTAAMADVPKPDGWDAAS